jgi:hypothetical protein
LVRIFAKVHKDGHRPTDTGVFAMPRIPDTDDALLDYARLHADLWAGDQSNPPPDTGLSAQQLADTSAATDAAEAAALLALQARSASKAATTAKKEALAALRQVLGADLTTIDGYAKATKDPGVYSRAQVDPPKTPTDRQAPPEPTELRATVDTDGSVDLTFKVAAGGGCVYLVQRMTVTLDNTTTPYELLGFATDEKKFTDNAVPDGIRTVGYRVAARIATGLQGSWSQTLLIPFGSQANNPVGSIAPAKAEDQKSAS